MRKKFVCIRQADSSDCGAACLASVAWYYGLKMPMSVIRSSTHTDARGTNVLGMVMAAEQLGFTAKGVRGTAQALTSVPLPAIAHVTTAEGMQHFVVIVSAAASQVTIADPARGVVKLAFDEFVKGWSGVLILLAPGPCFRRGDHTVSNLTRIVTLLKPYPRFILESGIGAIIYTLLGFLTALYIQYLVDDVFPNQDGRLLNVLGVGMIVLTLFRIFFGWARQVLLLHLSQKIDATLILGYYHHILHLPQSFFDTRRIGEIISRLNDAMKIRAAVSSASLTIIVDGVVVVCGFVFMFQYSWRLAMAALVMVPAFVALFYGLKNAIQKTGRDIMEGTAQLQAHLVSTISGISTIKLFQAEAYNNLATEAAFVRILDHVFRAGMQGVINASGSELINGVALVGLLWLGGTIVIDGGMSVGELMSFYALLGIVAAPASRMIGIHQTVQDALIAADRLFEIMELETEESVHPGRLHLREVAYDAVTFSHVSFRYGSRALALDDASFTIPKRTMTAIVGESGSGKSTIVKLMTGLYPCTQGEIRFGNVNIAEIALDDLRRSMAVVPQEIELFHGSVISNIAYGEAQPDEKKLRRVCELCGAETFISKLPQAWHTLLGEHGATLSGGERQRLALARALYKEPSLLILDEATSSLDSETEAAIQEAIRSLVNGGMTVLAIAHRLSTIMHADRIIVLDKGTVVEEGTHHSLMSQEEKYFSLWKRQMPFVASLPVKHGRTSRVGAGR